MYVYLLSSLFSFQCQGLVLISQLPLKSNHPKLRFVEHALHSSLLCPEGKQESSHLKTFSPADCSKTNFSKFTHVPHLNKPGYMCFTTPWRASKDDNNLQFKEQQGQVTPHLCKATAANFFSTKLKFIL